MQQNYNWEAHCRSLGISRDELFQVSDQEKLPRRQLSQKQSEQLLKALKRYAKQKESEAIAQGNLF